jgi:hypothetical protein
MAFVSWPDGPETMQPLRRRAARRATAGRRGYGRGPWGLRGAEVDEHAGVAGTDLVEQHGAPVTNEVDDAVVQDEQPRVGEHGTGEVRAQCRVWCRGIGRIR